MSNKANFLDFWGFAVVGCRVKFKKIKANFKNKGKFRGFLRISSRLADSVPPWGGFVFCQVLAAVMG